jgi:DnaJ-class molecular chaperone
MEFTCKNLMKGDVLMDKKLIIGIIIAIIVVAGLGAYMALQNPVNTTLNLSNTSNMTADSNSSVNSNSGQISSNNSNNQIQNNKTKVNAKRVICTACHGTGWDYCMGCHGTGLESCPKCGGDGIIPGITPIKCGNCGGDGKITCTICGGSGGKTKCDVCGGDGYIDPGDKGYSGQQ